jgi:hypothetical protein
VIKSWGAFWALMALVALAAFGLRLDLSAPYHRCNGANECGEAPKNENKPTDYMAPSLAVGHFLDDHNGAVNALAAIVIAFFTVVLALRTGGLFKETAALRAVADQQAINMKESIAVANRSALAAERAARIAEDSLVAVETPFLHPVIVGHQFKATWDGFVGSVGLGKAVQFRFQNIGRTPAILTDYYTCPIFSLGVPSPKDDLLAMHTGGLSTQVIRAGAFSTELSFNLNEGLYQSLFEGKFGRQGNNMLFFVGQSRYIDLFGNEFISGFCFAYAAARDEWYGFGGAAYNYRRRVERPADKGAQKD